ncbi:hypothetical protein BH24ACT15_BH24ACT15_01640 [soil metagenome]
MAGAEPPTIRFTYLDTPHGRVHAAVCEPASPVGPPVVLLHQTPRSWDEYREVLPLLGARRRVIALDTLGHGASDPPADHTIEAYSQGIRSALHVLGIGRYDLVGHHTGGVVAALVAAQAPDAVRALVLSSTPWVDEAGRAARAARPHTLDAVTPVMDASHLVELWQGRRDFYPPDRPDLVDRFIVDALRADDGPRGHRAVAEARMERWVADVAAPVLLVGHAQDPHAFPDVARLRHALQACGVSVAEKVIARGMVPLEHTATDFADVVETFLAAIDSDADDRGRRAPAEGV